MLELVAAVSQGLQRLNTLLLRKLSALAEVEKREYIAELLVTEDDVASRPLHFAVTELLNKEGADVGRFVVD